MSEGILAYDLVLPGRVEFDPEPVDEGCYWREGYAVHVEPGCRCKQRRGMPW